MLIRFFKSSFYLQYIVLLAIAAALWSRVFIAPCPPMAYGEESPLFSLMNSNHGFQHWVLPLFGLIILILNALVLNASLIRHELTPKNSLVGALVFIFLMSQSPASISLNPVLAASLFLIPAFDRIMSTFGKADPTQEVFSAAFLIALSSLLYFPSIIFLLILIFSFVVFGTFSLRIIMVAFSGILAVYLYLGLYYFITDQLQEQWAMYNDYFVHMSITLPGVSYHQYIIWGMHLILFTMSALYIFSHMNEWNISVRRRSTLIFWFTILAVLSIIPEMDSVKVAITIAAIPLTALVTTYLGAHKRPSRLLEIYLLVMILYSILNNSITGPC